MFHLFPTKGFTESILERLPLTGLEKIFGLVSRRKKNIADALAGGKSLGKNGRSVGAQRFDRPFSGGQIYVAHFSQQIFNKQQAKWQKGKETEGMDERRRVHTLSINRTLLPRERES